MGAGLSAKQYKYRFKFRKKIQYRNSKMNINQPMVTSLYNINIIFIGNVKQYKIRLNVQNNSFFKFHLYYEIPNRILNNNT